MEEFTNDKYEEYEVFNLLWDLHQEIMFIDKKERNKVFYPQVKISRACSTPNDTFIDKKNVIMVGAGSGISPYLPLLEEVIRDDRGKKNEFDFNSARLVFVARAGEQISWISNYLFHIINSPWVIPKLEFNIFLTLEKDLKTIPSFLFWRAFLLISYNKNLNIKRRGRMHSSLKYNGSHQTSESSKNSPIQVYFGRPNFEQIFKNSIDRNTSKIHVYSTSNLPMNKLLFDTAKKMTKETGVKFKHIYESTS